MSPQEIAPRHQKAILNPPVLSSTRLTTAGKREGDLPKLSDFDIVFVDLLVIDKFETSKQVSG